jgi:hypothetical protein
MTKKQENLTSKLILEDVDEKNKTALKIVDYYSYVYSIIERTNIAMGRRNTYRAENSSTTNQRLKTNAYASTH